MRVAVPYFTENLEYCLLVSDLRLHGNLALVPLRGDSGHDVLVFDVFFRHALLGKDCTHPSQSPLPGTKTAINIKISIQYKGIFLEAKTDTKQQPLSITDRGLLS